MRVDEIAEHEVDNTVPAPEWDGRLRPKRGQRKEPLPFSSGKNQSKNFWVCQKSLPGTVKKESAWRNCRSRRSSYSHFINRSKDVKQGSFPVSFPFITD